MTPTSPTDLDGLIAEFVLAVEKGQAPDPTEWLARHPEHAPALAEFIDDLGRFGSLLGMPQLADPDQTREFRPSPAQSEDLAARVGEPFGGYELMEEIGRGGMGTVYRARLTGTALVVALKQIQHRGPDGQATARFREEIESTAELRHPNIVPIYHVGEHEGQPYFTMALVEGGSLDRHLARYRGDLAATASLLAKVARAVHHAHQRRILHRDLKPANILLDGAGEPHVADFGLAARMDESGATLDGEPAAGSLPWMAPEAVRSAGALTTGVDVWALGVILYELLTGVRPFQGRTWEELRSAILDHVPPPAATVNPRVPRDLEAICRKCLAKDPDSRYESASAVALDLERWLRDEPVRARRPRRWERFARWSRKNPGVALGSAALLAFLFAGTTAALTLAREQDARVREAVCRGNEYAARGIAASILWRLGELGDAVASTASDPTLWAAVNRADWDATRTLLGARQKASIPSMPGQRGFITVYVLDPRGTIRAEYPRGQVEGKSYHGRDYFRRTLDYAGRAGRDGVHVSRVFASDNDGLDKLAVAAPFRPAGPGTDVWVLGATITTDSTLGLENLHDGPRQTILLAARDPNPPRGLMPAVSAEPPEYVVLVHRGYEPRQKCVPFRGGTLRPATAGPDEPELQLPGHGPSFAPDDNFADPLADVRPEYAGRWLAGSAPVGNTELVVLVEQRYEDAVAPQRWFLRWFLAWVGGLVGAGVTAFLALLVMRSLRTRAGADSKT